MAMASTLQRLCTWYRSQCDGEWEHTWGVKIGNLDNPGWCVEINLQGTRLEDVPFDEHKDLEHETEWIHCRRDGQTFQVDCGPERLDAALQVFLDWADSIENAG
jgi:immunity protein 53 of polymorphic toxin system